MTWNYFCKVREVMYWNIWKERLKKREVLNGSLQYKWKWWNIDRMEMISFQYLSLEATASDWSTWMSYQPVWGMCWQNNGVISSLPAWREWMATSRGKFYFLYDKVLPTIWLWSSKYVGWKKKRLNIIFLKLMNSLVIFMFFIESTFCDLCRFQVDFITV